MTLKNGILSYLAIGVISACVQACSGQTQVENKLNRRLVNRIGKNKEFFLVNF